ncbi:Aspartic proteinase-like protein 2 [Ananas comosus]|uniref:Aspartic proteinase-like protein 2 n=1 Tax=Ananas comosus TaxID=4615 RepID=A0A199UKK6_ANACO|nr:Aspartic proteinase-like protein 2 [Ananas comosus]
MARGAAALLPDLLLLLSFLLFVSGDGSGSPPARGGGGGSKSPLVLPLVLSYANSTSHRGRGVGADHFLRRRQLQKEDASRPNAHMRLYDDLLTNGYYTTRLYIGTPPQEFALIVDSGSTVTYVPCSSCEQCGNHQDPRFQPDQSSTYEPLKCNVDCTCDDEKNQCTYERQYAEMSSSSGVLGEDIISFGKESALEPQRAIFGCENSETGDLFTQHADGIIGLGRGQLSIMDQLVDKGVISDSFSLCYGGMDIGGGAMVLGGIPPPNDMVFSHSDPVRSPYYNIVLKEIHVDGKALQLDPRIFDSKHGTVLDSGTTYAYLPEQAFEAFRDAITSKLRSLKQIPGPDPNYKDICFAGAASDISQLSKTFPAVDMHSKVQGAYCLGVFQNGKDPTTLLGGIIVRNTLVTYDRQNEKIGFWKTNCSELWERLHLSGAPSPAPSSTSDTNSTVDMSPAVSPSGSQLPGQYEVGQIIFYMSINVTYLDLAPHIKELAVLIAHELGIDPHQVNSMNITSEGNHTLIKWAIFPAGSDKFMSNATAMDIILRLTEHRVRLPDNYGSYQLLEWNVEPPPKRSWWQQHIVGLSIGALAVAVIVLSAFLVRYIWKNKIKGPGTYRPVDAAVPEQELQPL